MRISSGAVVRLKSGGPNMLVIRVINGWARCIWVKQCDTTRQDFDMQTLRVVSEASR